MKNSTRDERTVDDFCVPNLADAFHRAAAIAVAVAVAAASCVTVVAHANMPGGTVTSYPAFRFSRHALITGVPGERNERQEKERKKKERKKERARKRSS